MFERLGNLVARHWVAVVLGWGVLAASLVLAAPSWNDVALDGDLAFLPADMPSSRGSELMARAFPQSRANSQMVVVFARDDERLQPGDFQFANVLSDRFRRRQQAAELPIRDVWTVDTRVVGRMLQSRNKRAALVVLQLDTEFMATANIDVLAEVQQEIAAVRDRQPAGLELGITGSAAIGGDMLAAAKESISNTEHSTLMLVLVILLLVYRAPLLVVVPMAAIAVSYVVSTHLVALLTQLKYVPGFDWWAFKIFKTTKIFIVVILYGAGTDYCLFLIARYKEALAAGHAPRAAVGRAMGGVGSALVASGLTTIVGLGMMLFADFGKYSNSGPAIALCLVVALAACMTLAPAMLVALGRSVFWPWGVATADKPTKIEATTNVAIANPISSAPAASWYANFWDWTGAIILRWPGTILVACLALMALPAREGLDVRITYDLLGELEADRPSVVGTQLMRRHFPAGETGPLTVLAWKDEPGFETPDGEHAIARLTKSLYFLKDASGERVAAYVRSVTEPMGDKPGFVQPFTAEGLLKMTSKQHPLTKERFVTRTPGLEGRVARFDVVLRADPFSVEAIDLVDLVQAKLADFALEDPAWQGVEFEFAGLTAGIRDLRTVTTSDRVRIQWLVVLGVLGVILAILRHPVVCVYLILSVLWSYFVTIGLTEWWFQWLYQDTYYGLDWKVPLFLFVILVAVGEDYNIYLVTRIFEEQDRLGAARGLRTALAATGGIITSCGIIMAGTFVSMMTGTLRGIVELGFALSLGVLLDTLVVRTVLVPAFLALLIRGEERLGIGTFAAKNSERQAAAAVDQVHASR